MVMDSLHCWHKLNIDATGALRDDLVLKSLMSDPEIFFEKKHFMLGIVEKDLVRVFNEDWLQDLESKQIRPKSMVIFYKKPYTDNNIHIDAVEPNDHFHRYALNIIGNPGHLNGSAASERWKNWKDTSTMEWYWVPNDEDQIEVASGSHEEYLVGNQPYMYTPWENPNYLRVAPDGKHTQISSLAFKNHRKHAYLINASVPHQVVTSDQAHLCFSLRDFMHPTPYSWAEVEDYYKELLGNNT